jgi:hypothetical protein
MAVEAVFTFPISVSPLFGVTPFNDRPDEYKAGRAETPTDFHGQVSAAG